MEISVARKFRRYATLHSRDLRGNLTGGGKKVTRETEGNKKKLPSVIEIPRRPWAFSLRVLTTRDCSRTLLFSKSRNPRRSLSFLLSLYRRWFRRKPRYSPPFFSTVLSSVHKRRSVELQTKYRSSCSTRYTTNNRFGFDLPIVVNCFANFSRTASELIFRREEIVAVRLTWKLTMLLTKFAFSRPALYTGDVPEWDFNDRFFDQSADSIFP